MAEDLASRMDDALGPEVAGRLSDILDDPRRARDVADVTVSEAKLELSRKCKAPIVVRTVDGSPVCVSPARRVALLRLAAAEGYGPDECAYRVLDGVSDGAADAIAGFVGLWLRQATADPEWRRAVLAGHEALSRLEGEPWMRVSGWRFAGAVCGSHTSAFMRVKGVQERAVPEVLALVDSGELGLWSAYELSQLPAADQRRIARESRAAGGRTVTELVKEAKAPVMGAAELARRVRRLAAAAREGGAQVAPLEVAELQAAAAELMAVSLGK